MEKDISKRHLSVFEQIRIFKVSQTILLKSTEWLLLGLMLSNPIMQKIKTSNKRFNKIIE